MGAVTSSDTKQNSDQDTDMLDIDQPQPVHIGAGASENTTTAVKSPPLESAAESALLDTNMPDFTSGVDESSSKEKPQEPQTEQQQPPNQDQNGDFVGALMNDFSNSANDNSNATDGNSNNASNNDNQSQFNQAENNSLDGFSQNNADFTQTIDADGNQDSGVSGPLDSAQGDDSITAFEAQGQQDQSGTQPDQHSQNPGNTINQDHQDQEKQQQQQQQQQGQGQDQASATGGQGDQMDPPPGGFDNFVDLESFDPNNFDFEF